jgi:hypothetical protein
MLKFWSKAPLNIAEVAEELDPEPKVQDHDSWKISWVAWTLSTGIKVLEDND